MFPGWDEEKKAADEILKAFANINNDGMNLSSQIEGENFESTEEKAKES